MKTPVEFMVNTPIPDNQGGATASYNCVGVAWAKMLPVKQARYQPFKEGATRLQIAKVFLVRSQQSFDLPSQVTAIDHICRVSGIDYRIHAVYDYDQDETFTVIELSERDAHDSGVITSDRYGG